MWYLFGSPLHKPMLFSVSLFDCDILSVAMFTQLSSQCSVFWHKCSSQRLSTCLLITYLIIPKTHLCWHQLSTSQISSDQNIYFLVVSGDNNTRGSGTHWQLFYRIMLIYLLNKLLIGSQSPSFYYYLI